MPTVDLEPRRKVGQCARCDAKIAEFQSNAAGNVEIKRMYPDAQRVQLVLTNGQRLDLSFCADATIDEIMTDMPLIWEKVVNAWRWEQRHVQTQVRDNPQRRAIQRRAMKKQIANPPIGYAFVKRWRDIDNALKLGRSKGFSEFSEVT